MKLSDIHIRDPFVLCENEAYYLYGTRAENFGTKTSGFDVYTSRDLENWSNAKTVFDSEKFGLNKDANWAPEVHKFNNKYYMFATFSLDNNNHATFSLLSDTPDGEFILNSVEPLTPKDWCSLDGTLYISKENKPYLVFCHEHTQILNGTVCCVELNEDLSKPVGEPKYLFSASNAFGCKPDNSHHYVTDGPFLCRGKNDKLYMIWSTIIEQKYKQCLCVSDSGEIEGPWIQLENIFEDDGGHGMIFEDFNGELKLSLHTPNNQPLERPKFYSIEDTGNRISIK